VAAAFLTGAAAAEVANLPREISEILTLQAAHGQPALLDALSRAAGMRRVGKGRAGRMLDGRTWDEFPGRRRLLAATHG